LLLAGYLAGKTHLQCSDVQEVVSEFSQESKVPARRPAGAESLSGSRLPVDPTNTSTALDIDLNKLQIDPSTADKLSREVGRLGFEQRGEQVQRLERGMLRLERSNLQLLAMVQQLVNAVKKPIDEGLK
jgi:hypothetical protein